MHNLGLYCNFNDIPLTVIGHPFAPIGMGEQMRSHIAAMAGVHLQFGVYDIFSCTSRDDPDHVSLVSSMETNDLGQGIRIFHINGDEVDSVLDRLQCEQQEFHNGYNIIIPAWELPCYPKAWAQKLKLFDEVWALSEFLRKSLARCNIPSILIGQSAEIKRGCFLPRKAFSIRESAFVLLSFIDLSSYEHRKNPTGVIELYSQVRSRLPAVELQLVLKVKNGTEPAGTWLEPIRLAHPEIVTIARPLTTYETTSLINACDCLVSLHRAEGFGRSLAEAMSLGRLALGTAWSGNLDFMTQGNSLMVDYQLRPVEAHEYPYAMDQYWAEPNIDHAASLLEQVLRSPSRGRDIAARGRRDIDLSSGHRAVGVRVLDRLRYIFDQTWKCAGTKRQQTVLV
jgi:glycosyltransferase involved in cell wall biosynthesis